MLIGVIPIVIYQIPPENGTIFSLTANGTYAILALIPKQFDAPEYLLFCISFFTLMNLYEKFSPITANVEAT